MREGGLSCEESFTLMILKSVNEEEEEGLLRRTGEGGWTEDVHTHTDPGGCIPL